MLTNVQINNFKSLVNLDLAIKPITILIGPNGSGKSSVLQALAVLKQSTYRGSSYTTIQASGTIVDLGRFRDISYQHNEEGTIRIHVGGSLVIPAEAEKYFDKSFGKLGYNLECRKDGVFECSVTLECGELLVDFIYRGSGRPDAKVRLRGNELRVDNPELRGLIPSLQLQGTDIGSFFNNLMANGDVIRNFIQDFYLVPAARGIDLYGLPLRQTSTDEFATSAGPIEQATRLIAKLNYSDLADTVSEWTLRLIGKEIRQRPVEHGQRFAQDDKNVYASVEFIKDNIKSVAVNEGYGINQLILLLTQLAIAKQGHTIGVEEPEVHLHPKAQSELAKILIEEVKKKNCSIIFTTHSEHMLYPFLVEIAKRTKGSLTKDHVVIYYFEYDDTRKATKVTPLNIDERGMIEGGLRGFFEEKIATLNEYLKALSNE